MRKALIATAIAFIACSNFVASGRLAKEQSVKKVDERLTATTSRFAFKLYGQVVKERGDKNVFVSPSSVALALAMTYNGAEGETRQAMAQTMEIQGMSVEDLNRGFGELKSVLANVDPQVQLRIANSLWADKKFSLNPAFIQRTKEYYGAEVATLDFADPAAPDTINSWVAKNTENKIPTIVDRISPEKILYLINAIYFKGQWQFEFEKAKTKDDVFRLAAGRQKQLPMMFQTREYQYYEEKDFQAVALPYGKGRVSMYVFLPGEHTTLEQFEQSLTAEKWTTWMQGFRRTPGDLKFPRFKVQYEANLNEVLISLGMAEAFDPKRANFSALGELKGERAYISEVRHKAYAEVNEEGTEAAAVTSVGIGVTSVQQPREKFTMKVDRPFFFAIRDNLTGVVLFMGSVADPQ